MSLRSTGITAQQETVYLWLLAHPHARRAGVATACALSPAAADAAIDALVRRGFAGIGSAGQIDAVDPSLVVPAVVEQARRQAHGRLDELGRVLSEVGELADTYRNHRVDRLIPVEAITDLEVLRALIPNLSRQTESEVRSMQRKATPAHAVRAGDQITAEAMKRGIRFRSLYHPALLHVDSHVESMAFTQMLGEHVRTGPTPFFRLLVSDTRLALVSATEGRLTGDTLIVRDPLLVRTLADVFDDCWERGHDVAVGGAVPTARALELLRQMASGATDVASARACGISERQVGRELARLMAITGTGNRLGLGVEATRRGWL